jgi:predicted RNase H-like HicB family nuclease
MTENVKPPEDVPYSISQGMDAQGDVTRVVHVPYVIEQDEDGGWYASAQLRPGVAAFGKGPTQEAAISDLRSGLELLIEEVGIPDELMLTLNVA